MTSTPPMTSKLAEKKDNTPGDEPPQCTFIVANEGDRLGDGWEPAGWIYGTGPVYRTHARQLTKSADER